MTAWFTEGNLGRALASVGANPAGIHELFDALWNAYGEPHRHYHDRTHVDVCLREFDRDVAATRRPGEIEVALWFHDAIYDTHANDNEAQSAAWARRALESLGVIESCTARVCKMIEATQTHVTGDDVDTQFLVDVDLGILGQPADVFEAYDDAIRAEYAWVEMRAYRKGRAAVLHSFLDRPSIFATRVYQDRFEAQARRNLERKCLELA